MTPEELRKISAVKDAWRVEGKAPFVHRNAQKKLHRDWPVLAKALDELTGMNTKENDR